MTFQCYIAKKQSFNGILLNMQLFDGMHLIFPTTVVGWLVGPSLQIANPAASSVVPLVPAQATADAIASMDLSLRIRLSGGLDTLSPVARDLFH